MKDLIKDLKNNDLCPEAIKVVRDYLEENPKEQEWINSLPKLEGDFDE